MMLTPLQSMNFLAAMLLLVLSADEEETFWVLVALLDEGALRWLRALLLTHFLLAADSGCGLQRPSRCRLSIVLSSSSAWLLQVFCIPSPSPTTCWAATWRWEVRCPPPHSQSSPVLPPLTQA